MATKDTLVLALAMKPRTIERDLIMERAVHGFYHDFESPLACPKIQLVADLSVAGLDDIATAVKEGVFDE